MTGDLGLVRAYIEIEKHTNIKYEYCKETNRLVIDRILPYPFFYPYAYGFIPNTLAPDDDELDVLIITDKPVKNDTFYDVYIIGVLLMEDEKGEDNKVLCILEEDYKNIKDICDLDEKTKKDLLWFFSHYKSSTFGKWSSVTGFESASVGKSIYLQSQLILIRKDAGE